MTVFQYDTGILTRYPTVVGGVILAQGMTNGPTPKDLQAAFIDEQQITLQRIGIYSFKSDSILVAMAYCFPQLWCRPNPIPQRC